MIIIKEDFFIFMEKCPYLLPVDICKDMRNLNNICTEETCPRIDNNELLSSVMELKDTLRKHNIT